MPEILIDATEAAELRKKAKRLDAFEKYWESQNGSTKALITACKDCVFVSTQNLKHGDKIGLSSYGVPVTISYSSSNIYCKTHPVSIFDCYSGKMIEMGYKRCEIINVYGNCPYFWRNEITKDASDTAKG